MPRAGDDRLPPAQDIARERVAGGERDQLVLLAADDQRSGAPAGEIRRRVGPQRHPAQRIGDPLRGRGPGQLADPADERRILRDHARRERGDHRLGPVLQGRAGLLLALLLRLGRVRTGLRAEEPGKEAKKPADKKKADKKKGGEEHKDAESRPEKKGW